MIRFLAVPRRVALGGVGALVVALGLSGAIPAAGVAPSETAPAVAPTVAPAAARLDRDALQRQLRSIVRAGAIGAVAELDSFGREWRGAAGRATLEPRRRAVPGAHFRAASNTKMLTSVLALQLVNRGRWTLDTTIGDVMPRLWPSRSDVTLRQLVSHTSGLPDYLVAVLTGVTSNRQFLHRISRPRSDRGLIRLAKTLPPTGAPGAAFSYSNTNFVVVGMMLRRATGQSPSRLAERRILRPARMTRTDWPTGRTRLPRPELHGYLDDGAGGWLDLARFNPALFSSAGALVTTARDLNRFQRALSGGRLLPRRLVRQMRAVQADDPVGGVQYGLGTYRLPDPCSPDPTRPRWVYGHDGATYGTFSVSMTAPGGRRTMTIAHTGRSTSVAANVEMVTLLYAGLGASCAAPAGRARTQWPVRELAAAITARQQALLP